MQTLQALLQALLATTACSACQQQWKHPYCKHSRRVLATVLAAETFDNQRDASTASTASTFEEKDIKEYIYSTDSNAYIDTRAQGGCVYVIISQKVLAVLASLAVA